MFYEVSCASLKCSCTQLKEMCSDVFLSKDFVVFILIERSECCELWEIILEIFILEVYSHGMSLSFHFDVLCFNDTLISL